jgi:hypothetical protein
LFVRTAVLGPLGLNTKHGCLFVLHVSGPLGLKPVKAYQGLLWPTKAFFGLPKSTKAFFGLPKHTKAFFGMPKPTKAFVGIPSLLFGFEIKQPRLTKIMP